MDKAEKIRAAKKKLKEFQSHKKDSVHDSNQNVEQKIEEIAPVKLEQQDQQQSKSKLASSYFDNLSIDSQIIPHKEEVIIQEQSVLLPPLEKHLDAKQINTIENVRCGNDELKEMQVLLDNQNLQITQLKSEVEFHRKIAANLQKNSEELNRLKELEKSHAEVVKILVTEKSSLNDMLQKLELSIQQLKGENEELHNRLNVSRHRVKQLESQTQNQLSQVSPQQAELESNNKKIEEMLSERVKEMQLSLEASEAERSELKLLLNQNRIEMENLQKNFDHVSTEYHLATVKIAQLTEGESNTDHQTVIPDQQSQFNVLNQEIAIKQRQINELNSVIDQLNNERDSSETQYQNYVTALTTEMHELKESYSKVAIENEKLSKREQELLKHVSDLERQIQQQLQKQKIYAEQNHEQSCNNQEEKEAELNKQINSIKEINKTLEAKISQLEIEKTDWTKSIDMKMEQIQELEFQLEKMRTVTPNLTQLMTEFEDKSTAASRALAQNQSLKEQLQELERAFVTLSNDKMELTDKLQSENHLCKELKSQYEKVETELAAVKENWHYKENEMIRLSKENTELEKKILQQNIEIDRLRHYESKDYHGTEGIVEKELENSKRLIESLTNKINILESNRESHPHSHDLQTHSHEDHSHVHDEEKHDSKHQHCGNSKKHLIEEIEMLRMEKNELLKAINDFQLSKKSNKERDELEGENKQLDNGDATEEMNDEKLKEISGSKSVTASMATEEALEKLQERFRRTMIEVADLTEEKQRLEHVVTQLQFETETIGEYITLYQTQRRLLKQKEHERDIQLKNLANDRELMQKKLLQLNGLIEKFVLQHVDQAEVASEVSRMIQKEDLDSEHLIIKNSKLNEKNLEKLKKETAGKILEILSDIKTTNVKNYDSNIGVEKSCACCFGELQTV